MSDNNLGGFQYPQLCFIELMDSMLFHKLIWEMATFLCFLNRAGYSIYSPS